METVAARIPSDLEESLRKIMDVEHLDRSAALRKLLEIGVKEWKQEFALRRLVEGKITLWKAAEIADATIWDMMDLVREKGFSLPIRAEDVLEDIKTAMEE